MREVRYWVAEDGTQFEDEYECAQYEKGKKLEECKDDFVFYDYNRRLIPLERATTERVCVVVVKTPAAANYIGDWFENDGCHSPFDGCEFGHEVGTWVYGEVLDVGDEWIKVEAEIERLQNFLAELEQ
jgi:hypothetical protein